MPRILQVVLGLFLIVAGVCSWEYMKAFWYEHFSNDKIVVFSSGPKIEQIQKLGQLVSLKIQVADILTSETEGGVGFFSGAKAA